MKGREVEGRGEMRLIKVLYMLLAPFVAVSFLVLAVLIGVVYILVLPLVAWNHLREWEYWENQITGLGWRKND